MTDEREEVRFRHKWLISPVGCVFAFVSLVPGVDPVRLRMRFCRIVGAEYLEDGEWKPADKLL